LHAAAKNTEVAVGRREEKRRREVRDAADLRHGQSKAH
jgi:hypothetical protein